MTAEDVAAKASGLLMRWRSDLLHAARLGPVLDVACGDGRNGLALALADRLGGENSRPADVSGLGDAVDAPASQALGSDERPWSSEVLPEVLLVDRSAEGIKGLVRSGLPQNAAFRLMDLETPEPPSFGVDAFGVVLVFRYLHRPLVPVLRACLAPGGMLVYETYLEGQEAYGKPRNPDHLLRRGELVAWFGDWEVLELYEGELAAPPRVMGRVVCRKPGATHFGK